MVKDIAYNGLTTAPDDYLCTDGDLADVVNLVNEQGALRPVFPPDALFSVRNGDYYSYSVILMHDVKPNKIYIVKRNDGVLYWGTLAYWDGTAGTHVTWTEDSQHPGNYTPSASVLTPSGFISATAIGNTLAVLTPTGTVYHLWNGTTYQYLGYKPPELLLEFFTSEGNHTTNSFEYVDSKSQLWDYWGWGDFYYTEGESVDEDKHSYNRTIKSHLNKFIATYATNAGKFMYPFLVRYAYRLYDGSLWLHSAPQLMIGHNRPNPLVVYAGDSPPGSEDAFAGDPPHIDLAIKGQFYTLQCVPVNDPSTDLAYWKDIITGVAVFITPPAYTYDMADDAEVDAMRNEQIQDDSGELSADKWKVMNMPRRTDAPEVIRDSGLFYLLKEWTLDEALAIAHDISTVDLTPANDYLPSLLNREVMSDDYDSHDQLIPSYSYVYNSRLHLAGLTKTPYAGPHPCEFAKLSSESGNKLVSDVMVVIKTGDGQLVTDRNFTLSNVGINGSTLKYFYYPNRNATEAYIVTSTADTIARLPLKPHKSLNGAVWFNDFSAASFGAATIPTGTLNSIDIRNTIYVSNANNPFRFPLDGIVTIGNVEVRALAAATKALSQGQFGQFPLYAFTSEGVWALGLTSDGSHVSQQPVTRDVILAPDSLLSIDSAVLFATTRGLMMLQGSNVACISDDIKQRRQPWPKCVPTAVSDILPNTGAFADYLAHRDTLFADYLNGAVMVYDYIHQRIIVARPERQWAYVYSIDTAKWSVILQSVTSKVNSYPDALAMAGEKLVNFCVENETTTTTNNGTTTTTDNVVWGMALTRPIDFQAPDILKTVDTVVQRGMFDIRTPRQATSDTADKNAVQQVLIGTRDFYNPLTVYSSDNHEMRRFRGSPYKAYRILAIARLKPGERLAGATFSLNPRQTNIIR